mmetsp:Transcript_9709/g.18217  ORF Transcript_9709/g.18217 Transcript_9709/m.18217 type:complete len:309 (-) Transcript_9709:141-1067(-)
MSENKTTFLFAISPLVLGHVLVPPLSFFYGERLHPSFPLTPILDLIYTAVTPPHLFQAKNVLALTLDPNQDYTADRIAPWFTHMFVHGTYEHMLLNLQGLILSAYPVHTEFGPSAVLGLFLLGGAVAELPSALHDRQAEAGGVLGTALLPKTLRRGLHSLLTYFRREVHCGSSGGVFSLMGATSALQSGRVLYLLRDCHRAGIAAYQRSSFALRRTIRDNSMNSTVSVYLSMTRLYLTSAFRRLLTIDALTTFSPLVSQALTISREVAYLGGEGASSINYAAHVQGYIFGFAATVTLASYRTFARCLV